MRTRGAMHRKKFALGCRAWSSEGRRVIRVIRVIRPEQAFADPHTRHDNVADRYSSIHLARRRLSAMPKRLPVQKAVELSSTGRSEGYHFAVFAFAVCWGAEGDRRNPLHVGETNNSPSHVGDSEPRGYYIWDIRWDIIWDIIDGILYGILYRYSMQR